MVQTHGKLPPPKQTGWSSQVVGGCALASVIVSWTWKYFCQCGMRTCEHYFQDVNSNVDGIRTRHDEYQDGMPNLDGTERLRQRVPRVYLRDAIRTRQYTPKFKKNYFAEM